MRVDLTVVGLDEHRLGEPEQFRLGNRLDQKILGALAQAPDAIGFLVFARDDDHGDVLGGFIGA